MLETCDINLPDRSKEEFKEALIDELSNYLENTRFDAMSEYALVCLGRKEMLEAVIAYIEKV
jgi:hypothetical protein